MEITMKLSSRLARLKPAKPSMKQPQLQAKPPSQSVVKKGFGLPRWGLIALCVLLTSGVTWAACEFVILSKLPSELVGKWVVVGGQQDGATFDFSRRGTMVARLNNNGREALVKATVTVEGDILCVTTPHPQTNVEDTRKIKILELTDRKLTLQDEKGEVWKMDRAN
jgi:uncharacterized protein (TIGR03066 family)